MHTDTFDPDPAPVPAFRLGTRRSPLAMAQAEEARMRLAAALGIMVDAIEIVAVTASGDQLAVIAEYVQSVARAFGLSERHTYQVQTAVDEACANVIFHAYANEGDGPISLACEKQGRELVIVIRDNGQPFDPSGVPEPDVNAPLEERREGGLGVYIMRQMIDELEYQFTPQGNMLRMVKYLGAT